MPAIVHKLSPLLRKRDDFFRTPAAATRALLSKETFPKQIWECACGDGAISRELEAAGYQVISTDLIDRNYGIPYRDFLLETTLLAPIITTNPPYKLADEFIMHALKLGATKVAMFCRLAFLEGAKRYKQL